ncbi:SDR family NAD(P)-dependent oxidoreductase [Arthrobacter globiformis]|uniref:SDR family NAD(P)-dependent oxidoreductase n=1 Tax=Arthrobacter globiformis TaxID=1665 RepID=UPI0027876581|nr:SDR family NAD(P)-dependent oxidoreductase [Arthrobacter globiformis]MDQ0867309.1 meso-butanediol dehydrogenase/(S,S)-butanediol dehydrogenase/diacetyl reductase [Arthrobacter globiformis]
MKELQGQVAVVTGAGQGIGRGIAQVLARHGANVVLTDLDEERAQVAAEEIKSVGGSALAVQQNVLDLESSVRVQESAIDNFGKFDILVNNAGVAIQKPFDEVTEKDWDLINDINSKALFFACQAAGKHFRSQRAGKIVNVASFCGKQAILEYAPYNASKFSVVGITQTLALELGPYGVNVNAVCPGVVKTPMWEALPPEQWAMQEEKIPLRRGQTAEDIGEAVAFLASERARSITGASVPITGGLAMW